MAIEGKVAKILNTRELIINKGSEHGVSDRMRFDVLEPEIYVVDPDTKANLGQLTRSKITVEIVQTEPQFSIGRTFDTYEEANFAASLSTVVPFPRYVTKVKTIRTAGEHQYREGSANVSVGDPVKQVEEISKKQQ